jgi:hypothetical protein
MTWPEQTRVPATHAVVLCCSAATVTEPAGSSPATLAVRTEEESHESTRRLRVHVRQHG